MQAEAEVYRPNLSNALARRKENAQPRPEHIRANYGEKDLTARDWAKACGVLGVTATHKALATISH